MGRGGAFPKADGLFLYAHRREKNAIFDRAHLDG